jgi:hypothetical protein
MRCPDPDARAAAARTGVYRYCQLCDPAHPSYDPAYLPLVKAIASGGPPSNPPEPATQSPPRCPYLDSCQCHGPLGPVCLHTVHGPARGTRSDRGWHVTPGDCLDCPSAPKLG